MAVPIGGSDSYDVSDRSSNPAEKTQSDLSSNVWNDMKHSGGQNDRVQAASSNNDVLDLNNNIYGDNGYEGVRLTSKPPQQPKPAEAEDPTCKKEAGPKTQINYLEDMKEFANKNFDKLDADKDGHLSEDELNKALEDPCLKGDDRKGVELLQKYSSQMEDLNDDEFGIENDGITKGDLSEFGKKVDLDKDAGDMYKTVKQNMDKIDADKDGHISRDELDKAIQAADPKSEDAKALQKIKEQFDDLQSKSNDEWGFENDGVTTEDLLRNAMEKSYDDDALYMDMSGDIMDHWLKKQKDLYPQLEIDY